LPSVSSPAIDSPVLLVQLSDSHLVAEADGAMFGLNTRDSLAQVVERVLVEQPNIDLLVATGDLSQDFCAGNRSHRRTDALAARQS
jgi:Icc protein